jgi:hypothetical protein
MYSKYEEINNTIDDDIYSISNDIKSYKIFDDEEIIGIINIDLYSNTTSSFIKKLIKLYKSKNLPVEKNLAAFAISPQTDTKYTLKIIKKDFSEYYDDVIKYVSLI